MRTRIIVLPVRVAGSKELTMSLKQRADALLARAADVQDVPGVIAMAARAGATIITGQPACCRR